MSDENQSFEWIEDLMLANEVCAECALLGLEPADAYKRYVGEDFLSTNPNWHKVAHGLAFKMREIKKRTRRTP